MKKTILMLLCSLMIFSTIGQSRLKRNLESKTRFSIAREATLEMRHYLDPIVRSDENKEQFSKTHLNEFYKEAIWNEDWDAITNHLAKLQGAKYDAELTQLMEEIVLFSYSLSDFEKSTYLFE